MAEKKDKKVLGPFLRNISVYLIAILLAFAVFSVLVALMGFDIFRALRTLTTTSFKSAFGFQETIKKTIPLIFTTYAFTIPFMIKFFNIGGWGQMLMGGTVATVVGLSLAPLNLPAVVLVPLLLISGILAGGLFALIAGYLKAKYDINPIISTIMLNFVAALFVNFIATAPRFKDPLEGHPITIPLPKSATLPFIGGIPSSIIFAILAIIFVYILIKKTRLGYEITAVGYNLFAAQTYGINFAKTIMVTFLIGGSLAGLGGALEIMTIHGKLIEGFAKTSGAQYGIFGILTSLIVAGDPIGVPIAAFLMSVLLVGADALQRTMQIPVELVFLSQALIVLFIVVIRKKFSVRR
ncbi:MAG: ABC transporter permease [Caldiserica bacterium]|nr:MAG: ABC transporter permease [Caldisericota bacterium]